MSTYLAGPMSPISFGLKGDVPKDWDWNFPQFNHFAEIYRQAGHTVVNPADNGADAKPNEEYYRLAVKQLVDCDHIVMLPGWESSKGANLELYIAQVLGMEITYLEAS